MDASVALTVARPNVCQRPENEAGKAVSAPRTAGAEYKAAIARAATVKPRFLFDWENIFMKKGFPRRWRTPPALGVLAVPIAASEKRTAVAQAGKRAVNGI
jgi:hypothetical protein